MCNTLMLGNSRVKFPKHFSLFVSKDKDKGHNLDLSLNTLLF